MPARNDDYNTTLYVATDDMPHIVSSPDRLPSAHFGGFLAIFHPIFLAERNTDGKLISLRGTGNSEPTWPAATPPPSVCPPLQLSEGAPEGSMVTIESWIAIRLTRYLNEDDLRLLEHDVRRVLADVRACYTDLEGMVTAVFDISQAMSCAAPPSATARGILRRQPARCGARLPRGGCAGLPALAHPRQLRVHGR